MTKAIFGMFDSLLESFKIPIYGFLIAIGFIIGLYIAFIIYYKVVKGVKTEGEYYVKPQKEGLLKILFYGLKQAAYDNCSRNIEHFPEKECGLIAVEGMPGEGKTTSCVYNTLELMKSYPKLKVYTNMDFEGQSGEISKWEHLMEYNNGKYGQVFILDELGVLMNSRNFRNFDVNAMDLITQSRKIHTRVLFTSQKWEFCDANIKRMTKELWLPMTFLKTICFVRVYKPIVAEDGTLKKKKLKRIFYYRQTPELRNCFDTDKQIAVLKRDGFAERSEQIKPDFPKAKQEIVIKDKKSFLKK